MPDYKKSEKYRKRKSRSRETSSSRSSCSEIFTQTDDASSVSLPPPPDGGWGWIIVLAAFLINLISDGISFSFGILYTELLSYFQTSKSDTSWVGSLFYGIPLICGPLASALATKYGCKRVTICGGILASAGMLISSFADSVGILCVTFGFVAGIGMSMGYVTSVVMVAFYFEKKRALATGLSVCGSGIGTFAFAPLTEYLISEYGWQGTLQIWAGITLNIVVCGCLLRPLEFSEAEKRRRALLAFEKMSRSVSRSSLPSRSRHISNDSSSSDSDSDDLGHCSLSQTQLPTFIKKKGKVPSELLAEVRNYTGNPDEMLKKYFMKLDSESSVPSAQELKAATREDMLTLTYSNGQEKIDFVKKPKEVAKNGKNNSDRVWRHQNSQKHRSGTPYLPLYRKDIFYRGNLMRVVAPCNIKSSSCPELYRPSLDESSSEEDIWDIWQTMHFSRHMKKLMKTLFDPTILRNPLFVIFSISNFVLYFWYDVPYVFMVDRAVEHGISEKSASFLISILGIVNTVGQILFGFIGDRSINLSGLYGTSICLCGVSILLVPLFGNYIPLAILSAGFGLFISANYALSTVILVEYLGLDKLTNAYGLTMMTQGLANLGGPPVAGWLYDVTRTYNATFYIGGGCIMFSGVLLFMVPLSKKVYRLCWRPLKPDHYLADQHNGLLGKDISFSIEPSEIVVVQMESVV